MKCLFFTIHFQTGALLLHLNKEVISLLYAIISDYKTLHRVSTLYPALLDIAG